jgi:hypothetical protein
MGMFKCIARPGDAATVESLERAKSVIPAKDAFVFRRNARDTSLCQTAGIASLSAAPQLQRAKKGQDRATAVDANPHLYH